MNAKNNFVGITDRNILTIPRHGYGVYKIDNIRCLYKLKNLYLIGWYSDDDVFNSDASEVDAMKKVLPSNVIIKSVGFKFNYMNLRLETHKNKIFTQRSCIRKLLTKDVKASLLSIIMLTSESWRFYPVAKACRINKYSLNLDDLIGKYVDGLPVELKFYTLRELIEDWEDLSEWKPIRIKFEDHKFADTTKILRLAL